MKKWWHYAIGAVGIALLGAAFAFVATRYAAVWTTLKQLTR